MFCIGFKEKTDFEYPEPIPLEYSMRDFLEDYVSSKHFLKEKDVKFVASQGTGKSAARKSTARFSCAKKGVVDVLIAILKQMDIAQYGGASSQVLSPEPPGA